ncbi:acetylornithine deacetylase [Vibrio sp. CAIM 722]|uniref:Acetylornithine deacetylase n=1 Tax=Vibrio eleionomae TaxID=2653505 RepID=A0A7X4RW44_9VIBR|nr:acetylornithine deacetylase [Vibrio eleionomae]MZI94957.1 acetylornithine deacetylase [Vibrio eleionomae]
MTDAELLERLIRFPTISSESNLDLIKYVADLLQSHGINTTQIDDPDQAKAALFASVGDPSVPGILLSGHSDVVPVAGQNWHYEPFYPQIESGKLYGRGACDMKGFLAVAINVMISLAQKPLSRPVHLAISFDEELGCLGVKDLLLHLKHIEVEPLLCIVGEPTLMNIALGHKGKAAYRVHCHGQEAHSSRAPLSVNAIYLACDVMAQLRQMQRDFKQHGARDEAYDIPYSTVHVGKIEGGKAINIVPQQCDFDFEIRHLAEDDLDASLNTVFEQAKEIVAQAREEHPDSNADIQFECMSRYPGLNTESDNAMVQSLMAHSTPETQLIKVAFGSEGGLFSQYLNAPVVVCGPGSIAQAHKPDEYVELTQLDACHQLLEQFTAHICE